MREIMYVYSVQSDVINNVSRVIARNISSAIEKYCQYWTANRENPIEVCNITAVVNEGEVIYSIYSASL